MRAVVALAVKRTKERLDQAVNAVLGADYLRLLAEADAMQAELIARRVALRYLYHDVLPGGPRSPEREAVASFLMHRDRDLPGIEPGWGTNWSKHPANLTWEAARGALMVDANAPLPMK
jgi:hypothetical protein